MRFGVSARIEDRDGRQRGIMAAEGKWDHGHEKICTNRGFWPGESLFRLGAFPKTPYGTRSSIHQPRREPPVYWWWKGDLAWRGDVPTTAFC